MPRQRMGLGHYGQTDSVSLFPFEMSFEILHVENFQLLVNTCLNISFRVHVRHCISLIFKFHIIEIHRSIQCFPSRKKWYSCLLNSIQL